MGRKPPKANTELEAMIREIIKAPLKLQQRIRILCHVALKQIEYEMVLGKAHRNTIKAVDGMVRETIRRWLRLAKDTLMAFPYVSSANGGMGGPQVGITVPLAQREKCRRLLTSPDEWIKSLATDDAVPVDKRIASLPIRVGNTDVGNTAEAVQAWRSQYTETLSLKGVRMDLMDKSSALWVRRPERFFPVFTSGALSLGQEYYHRKWIVLEARPIKLEFLSNAEGYVGTRN
ncbi:unnamed protein product [Dicrocoelium dendriticum]|nr:unnamed protein product [Dicrocoelium dendriticum]